jgi:hypothetical protein
MLGSVKQVNWNHIGEAQIKLFVMPLKNVGKRSVHISAEASACLYGCI